MLQILNRLSASFIARCLFGVLLIGFITFGIGDVLRMRSADTDVADVGNQTISADALDKEFKQRLATFGQKLGGKIDAAQAKRVGFLGHVLDAMIDETLVKLVIKDYDFRIGDRQVLSLIQTMPAFQDDDTHKFDRDRFTRVLGANQMNEATFVPYLRQQTAIKLFNDSELGQIQPPLLLVDGIYNFQQQQRRGETLHISNTAMNVPAPTGDQLNEYYKAHTDEFTAPEYRTFSYIAVSLPDVAKSITVSSDELKQAYDAKATEFTLPEKRQLKQFLSHNQATAEQVADLAKHGKSLAEAAKEANEPDHYFDLGLMSKADLLQSLQDPVFSAASGTILPPIKTTLGWHVVEIGKIEPPRQLTLTEVQATLEADLKADPTMDKLAEIEKKIDDQLAGGAKLSEAGTEFNVHPVTIGPVDADGKKPDGSDASELKGKEDILKAAFAVDVGAAAQMQEAKNGDAYAVAVDQITRPTARDFNLVKDKVAKDVAAELKQKAAMNEADALAAQAKKGTSFGALSKSANAIPVPIGPVTRDAKDKLVSPVVSKSLFGLVHAGDVGVVAEEDGPTLVHLLEIIPPAKGDSGKGQVEGGISSGLQKDLTAQYMLALRQHYPVKIHDKVLAQIEAD